MGYPSASVDTENITFPHILGMRAVKIELFNSCGSAPSPPSPTTGPILFVFIHLLINEKKTDKILAWRIHFGVGRLPRLANPGSAFVH